ncbi:MAG: uroporphyrinogen-III C-methyltransferase [Nitrospinota bacterium]
MNEPGTVYIVGAGPGDPGLITVRGLECLRRADVVVYDRLVNLRLLDETPMFSERINVGKAPGRHTIPQPEINALLVAKATQGKTVVRLKGGDPFVFGRGGEECEGLAKAGIPFEVIPGVSSAVGVPAYAGIPVTHRQFASAFTVITGHTCGPDVSAVDWGKLPKEGTLVILMGLSNLGNIATQLIEHGHKPQTPAAAIGWGTTAAQAVVEGTLADIAKKTGDMRPPATIVIGEVVNLRRNVAWFDPGRAEPADFPGVGRTSKEARAKAVELPALEDAAVAVEAG